MLINNHIINKKKTNMKNLETKKIRNQKLFI